MVRGTLAQKRNGDDYAARNYGPRGCPKPPSGRDRFLARQVDINSLMLAKGNDGRRPGFIIALCPHGYRMGPWLHRQLDRGISSASPVDGDDCASDRRMYDEHPLPIFSNQQHIDRRGTSSWQIDFRTERTIPVGLHLDDRLAGLDWRGWRKRRFAHQLAAYEDPGACDVALDFQSRHACVHLGDEPRQHRNSGFDFWRSLGFEAMQFGEGLGISSERLMRATDVVENNWIPDDRIHLEIEGDRIGVPESIKMLVALRLELGGASNIRRCRCSGLGQRAGRAGKHGEDYRAKNEQGR